MAESVDLSKIPILALRKTTVGLLSGGLNSHKVIPTDEGLPRDWRGLAHLIGLNGVETSRIAASNDPMAELIKIWGPQGTLDRLHQFLALIDRFDVLDDSQALIEKDVEVFMTKATTPSSSSLSSTNCIGASDSAILTVDDVVRLDQGLEPQQYDAYLLFAEEDITFASEIVDTMEQKYNMKLCIRDRDLVGGIAFEHDAIMKLIAERCRRLLVVVTPAFLRSPANKFFVTFAQALGIDQRQRKVIPILYERCELPRELSYYFLLDYNRAGLLWNFWDKLRDSIQTADATSTSSASQSAWMTRTHVTHTAPLPLKAGDSQQQQQQKSQPVSKTAKQNFSRSADLETSKKPLFKNITSSLTSLVMNTTHKEKLDKDPKEKSSPVSDPKQRKKKWFGRKKVEPLLS